MERRCEELRIVEECPDTLLFSELSFTLGQLMYAFRMLAGTVFNKECHVLN